MSDDSLKKRKEFVKKELFGDLFEEDFENELEEKFEDPKNSDIMHEKQSRPDDKDPKKRPRV